MNVKPARIRRSTLVLLGCAGLLLTAQLSCGKKQSTADPTPFLQAVDDYLHKNHMELKVKEVKAGPVVDQDHATMTASLTHAQLGGPAVTWDLKFKQRPDGTWEVLEHAVAK